MNVLEKTVKEVFSHKTSYEKFKDIMAKNNITEKEAISLIIESLDEETERAEKYEKKLKEAEIIIEFIQNNYNWCYHCDD